MSRALQMGLRVGLSLSSKLSAWRFSSGWVMPLMLTPQFPSTSGRISLAARVSGPTQRPGFSVSGPTCAIPTHGSSWRPRDRRWSGWRPPSLCVARMGRARPYLAAVSSTCCSSFPSGGARESAGSSWTLLSLRRSGGTARGFISGRTKTTSVRTVSTAAGASRRRGEPLTVRASGRATFEGPIAAKPRDPRTSRSASGTRSSRSLSARSGASRRSPQRAPAGRSPRCSTHPGK